MKEPRDPDTILAAWVDEGPNRLPEPIPVGRSRRHPNVPTEPAPPKWAPWRTPLMTPFARLRLRPWR